MALFSSSLCASVLALAVTHNCVSPVAFLRTTGLHWIHSRLSNHGDISSIGSSRPLDNELISGVQEQI